MLFVFGFAFLVRSVQGHATAVELLGFPFAFGYFTYKGYESYMLALGLALLGVGLVYRLVRETESWNVGKLVALAGLSTIIYLTHLLGWAVRSLANHWYWAVPATQLCVSPQLLLRAIKCQPAAS